MPTIPPPDDTFEWEGADELEEMAQFTPEQYDYIKQRLSMPPWTCPACGLVNHHYNQKCAWDKCKVPKP